MEDSKPKYKLHEIYPNSHNMNLGYWKRLQGVMDAAKTQSQSLALRKKWVDRQHLTNYRSEHDRLLGEFSHLKPELQRAAAQNIMDHDKLKAIGEYQEPKPPENEEE